MRGIALAVRAEAYRMARTRAMWFGALFLAAVSAARVFAARVADAAAEAQTATGATEALGLEEGRGWAPFADGWRAGLATGALLLLLHGARGLAADRERGILALALTRASSMHAVVLARTVLAVPLILAVFLVTGAGAWLVAALHYDFGPLVEDGYEFLSSEELRAELWASALSALPALVAVYAFGLLVSALQRTAAGAVTVAVVLLLGFELFKEALGDAQFWVFASFAPSFVDSSALGEFASVARGYSDAGYPAEVFERSLIVPWPQALVLTLLACWIASRRGR